MQIKNIMSENLITIDKDQNLSDGLRLLRKNKVSRLPVVNTNNDNEKELVGIVSERDIAYKLGSYKIDKLSPGKLHISSVMVKEVIAVDEDMDIGEVANILIENGIGSVPIESNETMVGIVSKADFTSLCVTKAYEKFTVEELMTTDLISVSSEDRLIHARRQLIDSKIGRLLVTEDNELAGMVTSKDVIRALMEFKKHTPEKHQQAQIKKLLVKDFMSTNIETISKDATIYDVASKMVETGYNGYPVVNDDDQVVGIITQTDLVKLVAQLEK